MFILSKIQRYIFGIAKKRAKKKNRSSHKQNLSYSEIKKCLLICYIDQEEDFQKVIALENALKKASKEVDVCCYIRTKKTTIQSTEKRLIITKKSLSSIGKPSAEIIDKIRNINYDAVFDVTEKTSVPLLYALINAQSALFCGIDNNKYFDYDFILETANCQNITEEFILEQFLFYIKQLHPKE